MAHHRDGTPSSSWQRPLRIKPDLSIYEVATDQAFSNVFRWLVGAAAADDTHPPRRFRRERVLARDGHQRHDLSLVPRSRLGAIGGAGPVLTGPAPGSPGSCALGNARPSSTAFRRSGSSPVGSPGERQENMKFCATAPSKQASAVELWLEPEARRADWTDVIAWKRPDGNMGVDIAFDYDTSVTSCSSGGRVDLSPRGRPIHSNAAAISASRDDTLSRGQLSGHGFRAG
jgi:hypothetical protein